MHWGKGILLTIIIFITGTVVMMVIAMNSPSDLVIKNYYEKGVKYQEQIDRINRTNALSEKVDMEFTGNSVLIKIPSVFSPDKVAGEILFYRPSDAKEDVRFPFSVDSSHSMLISTEKLEKGLWKVQLSWSSDGADYFNETSFTIK